MKTFIVNSGEWRDEVDINTELFDEYSSQCVEAMTLSLERWIENEDEFMIGPCAVHMVRMKDRLIMIM